MPEQLEGPLEAETPELCVLEASKQTDGDSS